MTITLQLPPELEAKLRTEIARHDAERLRQLLAEALAPAVEMLLRTGADQLSDEEFEALADELANEGAASIAPHAPLLSDYAVSRAGIYEDHA
ncbi:MAG: hypothetical protein FJ279_10365 [Planctomycetes bacterium]|nr:hypothetical protein [Planctomycetota bacterium]